jgi:hypothetical protein
VGNVVLVPGTTANRAVVADHAATFMTAFPHRGREARAWLRRPHGALSAVWFLSDAAGMHGTRHAGGPRRMRLPRGAWAPNGT